MAPPMAEAHKTTFFFSYQSSAFLYYPYDIELSESSTIENEN